MRYCMNSASQGRAKKKKALNLRTTQVGGEGVSKWSFMVYRNTFIK